MTFAVSEYWMGRDATHADELTDAIRAAAAKTVAAANAVLALFYQDNPTAAGKKLRSGWRPADINARAGGATNSAHMIGEAIDIADDDRELEKWCIANKDKLQSCGVLAMERPESTPSWCHWQTRVTASGTFYFWPDKAAYAAFVASGQKPQL
jgi:Peptidase M15